MKRFRFLIIACLIILVAFSTAFATSSSTESADILYELGLFKGTGIKEDGSPEFSLEKIPTRNEAVTMLVRLLGKEKEALAGNWDIPFTDVDDWAKPYVGYAYTNKLTFGTGETTFSGADTISSTQYLTFVLRTLGYDDSKDDFEWNNAYQIAYEVDITDVLYDENTHFDRGSVAQISENALSAKIKNEDTTLIKKLISNGAVDSTVAQQYYDVSNSNTGNSTPYIPYSKKQATFTYDESELIVTSSGEMTFPLLSRSGYEFIGWTDNDFFVDIVSGMGTEVTIVKGKRTLNVLEGQHYYALWLSNTSDTGVILLHPNANDVKYYSQDKCVFYGDELYRTLGYKLMCREGYVLTGWNTKPNGMGIHYAKDETIVIEGSSYKGHVTDLYAEWLKVDLPEQYVVLQTDSNHLFEDGSDYCIIDISNGGVLPTVQNYDCSYYWQWANIDHFEDGLYEYPIGGAIPKDSCYLYLYTSGFSKGYGDATTYYSFYPNGGINTDVGENDVHYDKPVCAGFVDEREFAEYIDSTYDYIDSYFEKNGYVLYSWNTKPDGSGVSYAAYDVPYIEGPQTILYAQWKSPDDSEAFVSSGDCGTKGNGENVRWVLYFDGTLKVYGSGRMADYLSTDPNTIIFAPWHNYLDVIKRVVISHGVTNVGKCAFSSCSKLNSVVFSDTVKTIGQSAFNACNLNSVTIPGTVQRIEDGAFCNNNKLSKIELKEGVKVIGEKVFNLDPVVSITIPASVTSIANGFGFQSWSSNLEEIIVAEGNENYVVVNGALYNKDMTELILYPRNHKGSSFVVPKGVVQIDDYAFRGNINLHSISLPSTVQRIGKFAFQKCTNITSIILPAELLYIEDAAFNFCGITNLNIPSKVKEIGNTAFSDCPITECIIAAPSVHLCDESFSRNGNLTTITFLSDAPVFESSTFSLVFDLSDSGFTSCTILYDSGNKTWNSVSKTANAYGGTDMVWATYSSAQWKSVYQCGQVPTFSNFILSGSTVSKITIWGSDVIDYNISNLEELSYYERSADGNEVDYILTNAADNLKEYRRQLLLHGYTETKDANVLEKDGVMVTTYLLSDDYLVVNIQ